MNRLTVWGIALFICSIVIAPSTIVESVVTGSDKTVVEISIETYGINGCRNTTAHLTLQQYCALNEFIADFHAHLKSSTTQREFVQAYTECYFKLEQLHLLTLGFDSSGLGRTTVIRAGNNLAKKT